MLFYPSTILHAVFSSQTSWDCMIAYITWLHTVSVLFWPFFFPHMSFYAQHILALWTQGFLKKGSIYPWFTPINQLINHCQHRCCYTSWWQWGQNMLVQTEAFQHWRLKWAGLSIFWGYMGIDSRRRKKPVQWLLHAWFPLLLHFNACYWWPER